MHEVKNNRAPAFGGLAWFLDPAVLTQFVRFEFGHYFFALVLLFSLFATNRYGDQQLIDFAGWDSHAYIEIAQAAPHLPSADLRIAFHHAQRAAIPYLIGLCSLLTHLSVQACFRGVLILLILAIVSQFTSLLSELSLPRNAKNILLLFFVFTPYTFRYYIAIPYMLTDLSFQLGLVIVVLGLFKQRPWFILLGFLWASLSRQTALLVIPLVLVWVYLVWPEAKPLGSKQRKALFSIAIVTIGILVYKASGALAALYAQPDINAHHLAGLLDWATTSFDPRLMAIFLARVLVPFVIPVCFILGLLFGCSPKNQAGPEKKKIFLLLGGAMLVCSQPILGGPMITGNSQTRLGTLAIVPFLMVIGFILERLNLEDEFFDQVFPYACLVASLGSFHHMFSYLGSSDFRLSGHFAAVTFLLSAMMFFIVLYFARVYSPKQEKYPARAASLL
jgi:hypothetical protein